MLLPFARAVKRKAQFKGDWGRVATTDVRAERISVSSGVRLTDATLDRDSSALYQGLGMGRNPRSTRHRQLNAPIGRNDLTVPIPVVSKTGVRRTTGISVAAVFCFLLGVAFLIQLSEMTELSKSVDKLQADIQQVQMENLTLERELAVKAREINVGYEATTRLGMVNPTSRDTVYVMAPETRSAKSLLRREIEVEPAHSEFFAALLGL